MKTAIGKKLWFNIILFGIFGQIAWVIENNYFNVFIYHTVAQNTSAVKIMVSASGIVATVATLLAGAFSDKIANRKFFISWGYIVWGIVVLSFGFITKNNVANLFNISDPKQIIIATLTIIVVMDCIMTFFGSTANDACFNAWVTDNTDTTNRGTVESVLSSLPLISMLLVVGVLGMFIKADNNYVGYYPAFIIIGAIVCICGIIGLFSIKDSPTLVKNSSGNYFKDIFYGFKPSVVKENKKLYLVFITMCIYSIACQIFFPYLMIYFEFYLGLKVMEYSIVLALAIIIAVIFSIIIGNLSDKKGKETFLIVSTVLFIVGLFLLFITASRTASTSTKMIVTGLVGVVMLVGYISLMLLLNATVRDYTPKDYAGKFQGIRMIFYVLIPMLIGPQIGDGVISLFAKKSADLSYVDVNTGLTCNVPVPQIFLFSAIFALLMIIPLIFVIRNLKNEKKS